MCILLLNPRMVSAGSQGCKLSTKEQAAVAQRAAEACSAAAPWCEDPSEALIPRPCTPACPSSSSPMQAPHKKDRGLHPSGLSGRARAASPGQVHSMEAAGAARLVRDLSEGVAPVDLCGQVAALAAEQRAGLGDTLEQHDHLRVQRLPQYQASDSTQALEQKRQRCFCSAL